MLKTLNFYVAKNFLYTFVMAMGVLTFGMTGARLVKVFEYVSNGVDIGTATIPWAALVSIMLVFGRLSADNEITAMRACGVSILQIVAPIIMLAFMLTCICLYLQLEVGPRYLGKAQTVVKSVAVDHPLALFEPGIPIDFNDFSMFIDQKNAETGEIKGIQVYSLRTPRSSRMRTTTIRIRAAVSARKCRSRSNTANSSTASGFRSGTNTWDMKDSMPFPS